MSLLSLRRLDPAQARAKDAALRARVRALGSLATGYSGGIDSAYLAWVAHAELGERALAVVAVSASYPEREKREALALAERLGLRTQAVETDELTDPRYAANPTNRCYFCKETLFVHLRRAAEAAGIAHIAYGAIADDRGDHRPGAQAALEYGALAPLQEVDLYKDEIRLLARDAGLPIWDKPSLACLSSRIPYGTPVTAELLARLEAAEELLRGEGFRQVRVRHHDTVARIEVERSELVRLTEGERPERIVAGLTALGWTHVALDLAGYRTGSMNAGREL